MEKKNEISWGKQPASSCQMMKLAREILEGIPNDLTYGDAEHWRCNKEKLHQELRKLLFCGFLPEVEEFDTWAQAYSEPEGYVWLALREIVSQRGRPKEFERMVVVHQSMTIAKISSLYIEANIGLRFRQISEEDLGMAEHKRYDSHIGRVPYVIWTKDMYRPDVVDTSSHDLLQTGNSYINLPEFLLLFWKHWQETGTVFDAGMFTLLPETQFEDKSVACAQWTGSHVEIFKAPRGLKNPTYGARQICPVA